jgi:hypothetical protein
MDIENGYFNESQGKGFISLDLLDPADLETYNLFLERKDIKIIKEVEKNIAGYVDKNFTVPRQKIKFIVYAYLSNNKKNTYLPVSDSFGRENKISLN